MTTVEEERAARAKQRNLEKAQRAAHRAQESERRRKLRQVIRDTGRQYSTCKCELDPGMSNRDLNRLAEGCTTHFICPRLVAVRRLMGI